jgi:hypothetical protein
MASAWIADYKGDASEAEWPALRRIAVEQFRADLRIADMHEEKRQFARACLELLAAD